MDLLNFLLLEGVKRLLFVENFHFRLLLGEIEKAAFLLKLPLPIAGILRVGDYQSNGARKQVGCELDLCSFLSTSRAQPAEQSSRLEQVDRK
ncbi:hypothetical protein CEXT_108011 [Caerostris extrusa]|uniref:Uncharacterized protein n=1 Tax=Caerostris extrusa TaxID=172846 RepID=A0AAV4MZE4_CAEEX|nr:hypothetical protein CEXT_108011 [Caerostris extrusa]